jgi:hypothetical protein
MSGNVVTILLAVVLLFFAGTAVVLLIRPSLFLRVVRNPLMPDTPWNRVQLRALGLVFCLFVLLVFSGGAQESELHEGFHLNILVGLWTSFFTMPILLWILWRFSVRSFIRRSYIDGTLEDHLWERRMTLIFCSLLSFIVALALLFAAKGHHP